MFFNKLLFHADLDENKQEILRQQIKVAKDIIDQRKMMGEKLVMDPKVKKIQLENKF